MDKVDVANDYIEWRTEQALKARKQAAKPVPAQVITECVDCGEEIPAARRERLPGVATYVPCQTRREKR